MTLPILAIGSGAVLAASQFESSFAGVRKTVKATDAEFAVMEQQFRDLAMTIPVNVNELNRLGEAAGALGIPKEEVVDFARVMALLGVTTNLTSDQAAESIAKIQNIFGAAGIATENFASTLVALGNDGASTEVEIVEMAKRIAGAGNIIGLTQGEVLAFASALASVGIEAEAGGTAISRVFIDIAAAVSEGGDAVAGFAEVVGVPMEEFQRLFKEDAAGAVEAFIGGLSRIKDSGGNLLGTLEELGFKEIRVRDALLRTAGAGDVLTRALDLQETAWVDNNALTREAEERFKTFESQAKLLYNQVYDLGIELGGQLIPHLRNIVDAAKPVLQQLVGMVQAFADLPQPIQTTVFGFIALAAVIGPIASVFGRIFQAASSVIGLFKTLGQTAVFKYLTGGGGLAGGLPALAMGGALAVGNSAMTRDEDEVNAAYMELANIPSVKGPAKDIELLSRSLNVLATGPGAPGFVAGSVVDLGEAFTGLSPALDGSAGAVKRAAEEQKRLHDEMVRGAAEAERAVTSFEFFQTRAAQPLQVALAGLGVRWDDLTEAIIPTRTGMDGLEPILAQLGNTTVPTLDEEMERLGYTLGDYGPTLEQARRGFDDASDGLVGFVLSSRGLQDIGGLLSMIGDAIGETADKFVDLASIALEAVNAVANRLAQGDIFGAIVAGATAVGRFITRAFRSAEEEVNPVRQAFVDAAGGLDALNRHAASVGLTLDRILDAENTEQYESAVDELTAAFEAQADTMESLGSIAEENYGFLDAATKRQIALALQHGQHVEEIAEFYRSQGSAAIEGSNAVISALGPQMAAWQQLAKDVAAARESGNASGITAALAAQATAAAGASQQLNDLGTIALATFSAGIASGMTFSQALAAAQPGLQTLATAFQTLGLETDNVALKTLLLQSSILENNPALLTAVGGLGQSMAALSNLGLLNSDTFAAMGRTGAEMYARIQGEVAALGGGTRDALIPMQEYLHQAQLAAESLGVPLDEVTQMMVDQSKELGIWQEKGASPTEQLNMGIATLVQSVQALIDKLSGVPGVIDKIPKTVSVDVDANVKYQLPDGIAGGDITWHDTSGGPLVIEARRGGLVTSRGIQHFAQGGFAQGRDTIPAMLSPGELVLNRAQQATVADAMQPSVNVTVNAQGAYFDEVTTERLARRIAEPLAKIIAGNKGSAHTQYRAALNLTV